MANVLGNLIQEQGQGWAYDPQNGETLVRRWKGTKQFAEAYYNQLKGQSGVLSVSIDQDGESPIYVVTARYGQVQAGAETDGTIPYFWELAGNMIDKSIFDNPKFLSGQAVNTGATPPVYISFDQVNVVKEAIQNNTSGEELSSLYAGWSETQKNLWSELIQGRETYQVSSWALRINRTFSSLYSNTIPTTNVGKVYTYAQIQSEAATISSPISIAINSNIPTGGEWLKQAPILTELSNRKLQMTQEWWWADSWSAFLYDAAT